MSEDDRDIIAAFVDDERVDTDGLKQALARPDGRDYLCELLALREVVGDRVPAAGQQGAPRPRAGAGRRRLLAVAAGVAVMSSLLGFGLGRREMSPAAEHGAAAFRNTTLNRAAGVGPAAPAPTRRIRLEAGVDWHERTGGN